METTRLLKKSASKAFKANNNNIVSSSNNKVNETVVNSFRNLTRISNIRAIEKPIFQTPNAKNTFNYLQLVFIKALIFWYFDLKSHIWIEINISSYAINKVMSQLNLDFDALSNDLNKSDFNQWDLVAYLSRKMVTIKI